MDEARPRSGVVDWVDQRFGRRVPATEQVSRQYSNVIDGYGQGLRVRIEGAAAAADMAEAALTALGKAPEAASEKVRADRLRALVAEVDRQVELLPKSWTDPRPVPNAKAVMGRLLAVELGYFHMTSPADQYSSARAARERFQRVAAPQALALRAVSQVPELTLPLSEAAIADTVELLNYIHAQYILDIAREVEVTDQKITLLFRLQRPLLALGLLALLMVAVAVVWRFADFLSKGSLGRSLLGAETAANAGFFLTQVPYFVIGLLIILALGYAGSIVSVAQRFQKAVESPVLSGDPVFAIGGLAAGWNGVRLAMASAAVFAGLAYLLFASGLANLLGLSGGLFPVPVGASECGLPPAGRAADSIAFTATEAAFRSGSAGDRFAFAMGLCSRTELMKMLIIAFLAGFSERLVPDILNQIADRAVPRQTPAPPQTVPSDEIEKPRDDGKRPPAIAPATPADGAPPETPADGAGHANSPNRPEQG
jgi:hypothetical protein